MSNPERPTHHEPVKATPEGIAAGLALSQLGWLNLAIQTGSTLALHEALIHVSPEIVAATAEVIFGVTVVTGILYEAHVLEKIGFSVNPATTFVQKTLQKTNIENPHLAATIGNIYGQLLFFFSPVDIGFTATSLAMHDGYQLFWANFISRSVTGFLFWNGINFALEHGHADELVNKIHKLRVEIVDDFEGHFTSNR